MNAFTDLFRQKTLQPELPPEKSVELTAAEAKTDALFKVLSQPRPWMIDVPEPAAAVLKGFPRLTAAMSLLPAVLVMQPWQVMTQDELVAKCYELLDVFLKEKS